MKKVMVSLLLLFFCNLPVYSQMFMRLAYQNSMPLAQMGRNIRGLAHGGGAEVGFVIPKTNLTLGWHWAILIYGVKSYEELEVFAPGAQSGVSTTVANYFTQSHFFINYDIPTKGKAKPYLSTGIGTSRFKTVMSIAAETSTTECPKPAETRIPLRDRVLHYVIGGGVKFDISESIGKTDGSRLFIDFHFQHVRGGNTTYLSVRKTDAPAPNTDPIFIKFSSEEQPDVIYDYYAGERYTSPVRLFTMQIGFSYVAKLDL